MSPRKFRVLLADDSEDDRFLIGRAFRRSPDFDLVHEVDTGDQVIDYLSGAGEYADRAMYPLPDLLLLDLKMPRTDGFDVLQWLNGSKVKPPRVVVFSSSPLPRDVRRALELGADSYQLKPRHIEDLPVLIEKFRFLLSTREPEIVCPSCGAVRCDLEKHQGAETLRG
jgi:CheY-like chemotaxis protein